MSKSPRVTIYINHSSPAVTFRNDVIVPIQVGRVIASQQLDMIGDDAGDNISERNRRYCELTSQYWAWKNDKESDYFGFMHYRRFLDFEPTAERVVTPHGVIVDRFTQDFVDDFGLQPEAVLRETVGFDIILPELYDISASMPSENTVEKQYKTAPHHFAKDYELAREAVRRLDPNCVKFFNRVSADNKFFAANIFVMSRKYFNEYCEWLFPILDDIDSHIDYKNYTIQEARVVGYLAERLLNVFVMKKRATVPDLKVKTLRRVFLADAKAEPPALAPPTTNQKIATVVASTDRSYLPHMAGLLVSTLRNAAPNHFIDFIILDGGLSAYERAELSKLARARPATSLRFIDMTQEFTDVPVHSYFARSTFYRLALPRLLPDHEKVVFLDTDMTVLGDVGELIDTPLDGKVAAAVPDLIMRTFCAMGVRSIHTSGEKPALQYLQDKIGLYNATNAYFQAGVLVMNLAEMRKLMLSDRMIADIKSNVYWFLDQDVLNKHLFGRTKALDYVWNVVTIPEDHLKYLSAVDREAYEASQKEPRIVHFAGVGKPWESGENPLSHYYWRYVRETPWYEHSLLSSIRYQSGGKTESSPAPVAISNRATWRIGSGVWRALPRGLQERIKPLATRIDHALKR